MGNGNGKASSILARQPGGENTTATALGFVRVAAITPELRVADVEFNKRAILAALEDAATQGVALALFPELGVTGYTCADLFYQQLLRDEAAAALLDIAEATSRLHLAAVVGFPLEIGGRLFNCAAFAANGEVRGIVPKTFLPNTGEYYEDRWFASAREASVNTINLGGRDVPFGTDLLFEASNLPGCVVGIEICEDLWAVDPPSGDQALVGATLLLNPSASDEVLGKVGYRRDLVTQQSARCLAAYLYAGAGPGESTTDVVFSGHSLIAEDGSLLTETERFRFSTQAAIADIDLQRLTQDRAKNSSFSFGRAGQTFRRVRFVAETRTEPYWKATLRRPQVAQMPFVPLDPALRAASSEEIFNIQATGLAKRLKHIGLKAVTLGLSGGLDSTLALLVTRRAFDMLGLPPSGIVCITMPGFGTTKRTRSNAIDLAELLGVTLREIPIGDAVRQHLKDIGHADGQHDITYENAQARERTQIAMDVANQIGGLVVGTGDLSELALGWATYNGDQMSMYHVNAGVPKTLVRYLIEWCAESLYEGEASAVLRDIVATPISPELLPLGGAHADTLEQQTELTVGPYLLHDFFLYYAVRFGFAPRKVFLLACQAFAGVHDEAEIVRWLREFYTRFFANQFKRSAMPDGPKVGSVALSPRGDWRMPSDANATLWLRQIDEIAARVAKAAKPTRKGANAATPVGGRA